MSKRMGRSKIGKPDGRSWVPPSDWALLWRVSPSRIRQMCRNGELEAKKINRRWFIRLGPYGRDVLEKTKALLQGGRSEA